MRENPENKPHKPPRLFGQVEVQPIFLDASTTYYDRHVAEAMRDPWVRLDEDRA